MTGSMYYSFDFTKKTIIGISCDEVQRSSFMIFYSQVDAIEG